jgi:hypothetical protein
MKLDTAHTLQQLCIRDSPGVPFKKETKMTTTEILWLTVFAYAVVQVVFLFESNGQTRIAVALPLLVMVPIFLGAVWAMQNDYHPTLLFAASPLALTYLAYVDYRSWPLFDGTARFR